MTLTSRSARVRRDAPHLCRATNPRAGHKPARGRATSAGFTLLEIAVVLFIIGLLTTLATPYIGGLRSAKLRTETRKLAGRASFLYDQASSHKLVMRLTFDLDGNRYFVERLDPYAAEPLFTPARDAGLAPVILPTGVRIRDVTTEEVGTLTRGMISCEFYPEGWVDNTVVHMVDESGDVFTLRFDPLTGRVQIARGDKPANMPLPLAAQ